MAGAKKTTGFYSVSGTIGLIRKIVPSDNSCLFTSVNFCVGNRDSTWPIALPIETNVEAVQETRKLIAQTVLSDSTNFSEAILGMPAEDYATFILEVSWFTFIGLILVVFALIYWF